MKQIQYKDNRFLDVFQQGEVLINDGLEDFSIYKGVVVQWNEHYNLEPLCFIDSLTFKVGMHLLRIYYNDGELYLLWKGYVTHILRQYEEGRRVIINALLQDVTTQIMFSIKESKIAK